MQIKCSLRWWHYNEIRHLWGLFPDKIDFTNVTRILESKFARVFEAPITNLVRMREEADKRNDKVLGLTAKAIGNYAFGSTLKQISELKNTKLANEKQYDRAVKKCTFDSAIPVGRNHYEICFVPRKKCFRIPYLIGVSVLMLSKNRYIIYDNHGGALWPKFAHFQIERIGLWVLWKIFSEERVWGETEKLNLKWAIKCFQNCQVAYIDTDGFAMLTADAGEDHMQTFTRKISQIWCICDRSVRTPRWICSGPLLCYIWSTLPQITEIALRKTST